MIIIIYSCTIVSTFFYPLGYIADVLLVILSFLIIYFCYRKTNGFWDLAVLYANHILAVCISSFLITNLYYEKISNDDMTRVVGNIGTLILMIMTLLLVSIGIFLRLRNTKEKK